jgi:hypothetical protein
MYSLKKGVEPFGFVMEKRSIHVHEGMSQEDLAIIAQEDALKHLVEEVDESGEKKKLSEEAKGDE